MIPEKIKPTPKWIANYGLISFLTLFLLGFTRLLSQDAPGHYRIFTGAARALWLGINPYGQDFGTQVGLWFYSPTCAMFFFGPFLLLPEKLGLALYMLSAVAVFHLGSLKFFTAVTPELDPEKRKTTFQLYLLLTAPQLMTAVLASKLEILIMGILFLSATWLINSQRTVLSAALTALMLNWKFQPVPIFGLIGLTLLICQKSVKWSALTILFLVVWFILPLAFVDQGILLQSHETWTQTLSQFILTSWMNFENIYAFLARFTGFPTSYDQTQWMSILYGVFLAALLSWKLISYGSTDSGDSTHERTIRGIEYSFVAGSIFIVALSPLGQNNAFILLAPLYYLMAYICLNRPTFFKTKSFDRILVFASWSFLALAYSDLVPKHLGLSLREARLKSPLLLVVGSALCIRASFRKNLSKKAE